VRISITSLASYLLVVKFLFLYSIGFELTGSSTLKKIDPNEVAEKEKRSNLYKMAAARDGINEMHPEIIEKRIQVRVVISYGCELLIE